MKENMWIIVDAVEQTALVTERGKSIEFETQDVAERYAENLCGLYEARRK